MDALDAITKLGTLGANGIMLAILYTLWKEFQEQNKFIRDMLLSAEKDREALAQAVGAPPLPHSGERE